MPARRTDRLPRHLLPEWLRDYEAERLDFETPVYRISRGLRDQFVAKRPRCNLGTRPALLSVNTWSLGGGWVLQPFVETDHQDLALRALRSIAKRNSIDLSEVDFVSGNCGWASNGSPVLFDW